MRKSNVRTQDQWLFVEHHYELAYCAFELKNEDARQQLVNCSRKELNYSPKTWEKDILHGLSKKFEVIKKRKEAYGIKVN